MDLDNKPIYLVQRVAWRPFNADFDPYAAPDYYLCPDPSAGTPVKVFLDRARAEEFCAECERGARGQDNPYQPNPNPFLFGKKLKQQTSMPEAIFLDWLRDADLTPPSPSGEKGRRNWRSWWKKNVKSMSLAQREKVWEALDLIRFYTVVELCADQ